MNNPTVLYLSGPVSAGRVYDSWKSGSKDRAYFGTDYLYSFFELVSEKGLRAVVISLLPGADRDEGAIKIVHRPPPLEDRGGILFHLGQIYYICWFVFFAISKGATAVIVTPSRPYWFLLCVLRLFKIKIIASIHCVLWPIAERPPAAIVMLYRLTSLFFRRCADAILMHSDSIQEQVLELAPQARSKVYRFLPVYEGAQFESIPGPQRVNEVFRVAFLGRVEANKGVFDLVEIAHRLRGCSNPGFLFEVCGDGSDLREVVALSVDRNLQGMIVFHGSCGASQVAEVLGRSHVVIVPTRTEFIEGFNKVVVEGVLARRPVISSRVCPSISEVSEAVLEVEPNDVDGYVDALRVLATDSEVYWGLHRASMKYKSVFTDRERGWSSVLEKALGDCGIAL